MTSAKSVVDVSSFNQAVVPPVAGGPVLRALLTSDGSITLLLEAFFDEQVNVVKLSERETTFREDQPLLGASAGDPTLERTILLRGSTSQRTYLRAHTHIALDNIGLSFKNSLVSTKDPIGKLWDRHRVETYKRILGFEKRFAGDLAHEFNTDKDSLLVSRTYQVFSDQKCVMLIEETFPENLT